MTPRKASLRAAHRANYRNARQTSLDSLKDCIFAGGPAGDELSPRVCWPGVADVVACGLRLSGLDAGGPGSGTAAAAGAEGVCTGAMARTHETRRSGNGTNLECGERSSTP
jgi:hypothetical protein